MSTLGMIFINASVGARGRNAPDDVRTIQSQLNALMPPGRPRLMVDGKCGPLTIDAIRTFQKVVCGMQWPDGLVDPDKRTIAALSDPKSARTWAGLGPAIAPATPANTTPVTASPPGAPTPTGQQRDKVAAQIGDLPAPTRYRVNVTPEFDGHVTRYEAPDVQNESFFHRHRTAIFVNGMLNSADDHRSAAHLLSSLLSCPVLGVYNKSTGELPDLAQCVTDKLGFGGNARDMPHTAAAWRALVDAQYAAYRAAGLAATRVEFVESLIAGNLATLSLFRLLRSEAGRDPRVVIYAHSQGNLITSNALTAVAMADGESAIRGRTVESYGSPCRVWPEGLTRREHVFQLDPIPLLQLRQSTDTIVVRQTLGVLFSPSAVHAIEAYIEADPEFIINSCRWSPRGFLPFLDKPALAQRLVELGDNAKRILDVFKRLIEKHYTAEDDVALHYLQRMRIVGAHVLQRTVNHTQYGGELVDVLDRCLTGRALFVSQEKQDLSLWVRSLRR